MALAELEQGITDTRRVMAALPEMVASLDRGASAESPGE